MAANPFLKFELSNSDFSANTEVESGNKQFNKEGNPLTSSAGAIGIAQVMPGTAPEAAKLAGLEWNPFSYKFDETYNKKLGEAYHNKQKETFGGDLEKADAAYNAGPGTVQKAIDRAKKEGGSWKDYLPEETKKYIPSVASNRTEPSKSTETTTTSTDNPFAKFEIPETSTSKQDASNPFVKFENPASTEPQSVLGTFASHTAAGVVPTMGGHAAGTLFAGAAEEAIGIPLAPFTGGHSTWIAPALGYLGGFALGSLGTGSVQRHLLPDQVNQYLDQGAAQNKYAAEGGDLASLFPVFGAAIPQLTKKGLQRAGLLTAGGLAFEGTHQAIQGEFDPLKLAMVSLSMPFIAEKPTILGDIASLKGLRSTTSKEKSSDLVESPFYIPKEVNGLKVIDLTKETPETYAARHSIPVETVTTHQETRFEDQGPIRIHLINNVPHIEIDPVKLESHFASGKATKELGLAPDTFKTSQDYADFILHRESIKLETPFSKWQTENPDYNSNLTYSSRKSYYDEIKTLESAGKDITPENQIRLDELKANKPPAPVVKDPSNLAPHELKSIIYGSKNIGEAIDRIVAGKFGGVKAQNAFKLLQKGGYLSDADLVTLETIHPQHKSVYDYGENIHRITTYGNTNLRDFAHEIFHAGTVKALDDPANVLLKEKFNKFFDDLKTTAEAKDLPVEGNATSPATGQYGLTNTYEMIAEAFTNGEFQNWLKDRSILLNNKPRSGFNAFKDLVKDTLGIKDKESISAFDQVVDLTHELTNQKDKYGKWDRESTLNEFDYKEGSYNAFLNKAALEAAEAKPFYNVDNINIPDTPVDFMDLPNFLYTLDNGQRIDKMRAELIYKQAMKDYNLTPAQLNRLRVFVEGLHEDHVSLHSQALSLDEASAEIKRSINQETRQRDVQEGSPNWIKWDNIKKSKPPWEPKYGPLNWDRYSDLYVQKPYNLSWNAYIKSLNKSDAELVLDHMSYSQSWKDHIATLPEADQNFANSHRPFLRQVALRLKSVEKNKVEAEKLRATAKQRLEFTPEEQKVFDEVYTPLLKERRQGLLYLMKEGVIEKQKFEEDNFPRKMLPMTPSELAALKAKRAEAGLGEEELGYWGKFKNYLAELAGGDQGGFNADMERRRGATQSRALFVLEQASGKRDVIQIEKNGNIIKWEKGEPKFLSRKTNPDGSTLTESGQIKVGDEILGGKIVEGSMEELEYHSPYRYNRNSLAVLLDSTNQIREQIRINEGLKNLTHSDLWKEIAIKVEPRVTMPEGWRMPTTVEKIPSLVGYAFPQKVAEIIEDFARVRDPNLLTSIAGMLIKNMMMNPLPHMFNEAWHLFNARGLSGWVTPSGVYRFAKYTKEATSDVLNQTQFYRDTLAYGGSLLAPGTRTSVLQDALFTTGMKEYAETSDFKQLAKTLGRSPGELFNSISKKSNKAMWITRDIMYIQYLKELMATKGLNHAEAIQFADRHMPNYRLPSRVGEKVLGAKLGRGLSSVLQNPNISVFSRYHYGMTKSIIETVKDLGAIRKGKAGLEEFKDGVDTAAAVAVALAVVYPLMDMLAQEITGNPNAKQRRAGPYHFAHAIAEVADGSKDPQAVLSSVFTFNPALQGLVQLGLDRNLYNGQQIYNPQSAPDVIAHDIGKYVLQQVPQAGQVMRAEADRSGPAEGYSTMAARQLDIEAKSPYKEFKSKKRQHTLENIGKKHTAKVRAGVD